MLTHAHSDAHTHRCDGDKLRNGLEHNDAVSAKALLPKGTERQQRLVFSHLPSAHNCKLSVWLLDVDWIVKSKCRRTSWSGGGSDRVRRPASALGSS